MDEKACFKCGEVKSLAAFYRHKMMADGHLNKCKECAKADVRRHRAESPNPRAYDRKRYREDPERRRKIAESAERRRKANPGKVNAQQRVRRAVKSGKLERPSTCSRCGEGGRIEGHHHDYSKPLEVEWLCARCHRREHWAKPF